MCKLCLALCCWNKTFSINVSGWQHVFLQNLDTVYCSALTCRNVQIIRVMCTTAVQTPSFHFIWVHLKWPEAQRRQQNVWILWFGGLSLMGHLQFTLWKQSWRIYLSLLTVSQHAFAVEVFAGAESVLLPCRIDFVPHVSIVSWSRRDLSPSTVHKCVRTGDELKDQNQRYNHRTSMRTDALRTGDLSLTLKKPHISDSGTYTCTVREYGQDRTLKEVPLQVKGTSNYCTVTLQKCSKGQVIYISCEHLGLRS